MQAIVCTKYGPPDVLELQDVKKPVPKENEVLIRIHSTTVTAGDCEVRDFKIPVLFWLPIRLFMGITKPRIKILGQEFAGEIEAAGKEVKQLKKGDRVFGTTEMRLGAYGEYLCLPETFPIAKMPAGVSYDDAAALPVGGLNALYFLRKADIFPGNAAFAKSKKILINGAGGSIGTFAVQFAKLSGAEVTAVDSTNKLETLLEAGADRVIDYTKEDFTKNGIMYDVIFDIPGKASLSHSIGSLNKNGYYLSANPRLIKMIRGIWISLTGSKKVITGIAPEKAEDLIYLSQLLKTRKIKSFIDKRYRLQQIPEAHRYVEAGHKKGNIVITV